MKIASSNIGMDSARNFVSVRMDSYHTATTTNDLLNNDSPRKWLGQPADLSERFADVRTRSSAPFRRNQDNEKKVRAQSIEWLLMLLFGHGGSSDPSPITSSLTLTEQTTVTTESHYFAESEETSFSTTGTVITADGKEHSFQLSFAMSRSFESYYTKKHTSSTFNVQFCDPLVINLETDVAKVSDQKFLFDLDCDGEKDNISRLDSGSGYLALDLNGDGVINDGSELFGTRSGDGFSDLARYDSDGNGWIDENDEIWRRLRIWTQDDRGNNKLYTLSDKNVGAIYLGNVSTDYSLQSSKGNTNAAIRKTGIFLYENGMAGTVQHLDLVK